MISTPLCLIVAHSRSVRSSFSPSACTSDNWGAPSRVFSPARYCQQHAHTAARAGLASHLRGAQGAAATRRPGRPRHAAAAGRPASRQTRGWTQTWIVGAAWWARRSAVPAGAARKGGVAAPRWTCVPFSSHDHRSRALLLARSLHSTAQRTQAQLMQNDGQWAVQAAATGQQQGSRGQCACRSRGVCGRGARCAQKTAIKRRPMGTCGRQRMHFFSPLPHHNLSCALPHCRLNPYCHRPQRLNQQPRKLLQLRPWFQQTPRRPWRR